jgi:hypothetical protein
MTEAHTLPHSAAGQPYFSAPEWDRLQADDRHGATMVLGLMTSIFTIGLILYLIVLFSVL